MGTSLSFYSVDAKKWIGRIEPPSIPRHPRRINDPAPKERWDLDLLTEEGENKLRAIFEDMKQACQAL